MVSEIDSNGIVDGPCLGLWRRRQGVPFNCQVDQIEKWVNTELRDRFNYRPRYPPRGRAGIAVEL